MTSGPVVVIHTISCLHCIMRILGECLLISSLPGKALRMLVDIVRLSDRFTMRFQSQAW